MTNEEFYDKEIAPVLLSLAKQCEQQSMGFFACVAFDDQGGIGRTVAQPHARPAIITWLNILAQCAEKDGINIDKFVFACARNGRERGHTSAVLRMLDVPTEPEET